MGSSYVALEMKRLVPRGSLEDVARFQLQAGTVEVGEFGL